MELHVEVLITRHKRQFILVGRDQTGSTRHSGLEHPGPTLGHSFGRFLHLSNWQTHLDCQPVSVPRSGFARRDSGDYDQRCPTNAPISAIPW